MNVYGFHWIRTQILLFHWHLIGFTVKVFSVTIAVRYKRLYSLYLKLLSAKRKRFLDSYVIRLPLTKQTK